jgi:hypothetical protein
MAAPARPAAAASVSGSFALPPDARCPIDQPRRREVLSHLLLPMISTRLSSGPDPLRDERVLAGRPDGADARLQPAGVLPQGCRRGRRGGVHAEAGRGAAALARRHRGQALAARALLLQAREVHRGAAQRRHGLPQRGHGQLLLHREEPQTGQSLLCKIHVVWIQGRR